MKLTILKEKLKEGLYLIERVSKKYLTLPILETCLLENEKNLLKLSATNLESGIIFRSLAKIEKEGKICIPIRFFSNLLSFFPNKPLILETDNLNLNLECDNYKTKIKGFNPEDFPIIPQIKEEEVIKVNSIGFCRALSQIVNIPSPLLSKPEISGIFFSFQTDLIKMVATDSFRLVEKKIYQNLNLEKEYCFILPQSAAKEVVSIFGDKEGELKIFLSPNQIFFEYMMSEISQPQIQFCSRLIEGEYPNYQEIIPKKFETQIQIQKEEFLNQLKTASLFSGKVNEVNLKIDPKDKKIEITSQSPDLGEYKSFLEGKIKGKEILVSFNHRFLIEGISEIKSKELFFDLTDKEGPAALKSAQPEVGRPEEDYLYIVMPVKTS